MLPNAVLVVIVGTVVIAGFAFKLWLWCFQILPAIVG